MNKKNAFIATKDLLKNSVSCMSWFAIMSFGADAEIGTKTLHQVAIEF